MRLTVLKITPTKSRYGKEFFYIFLKGDNGNSFKTCAYPSFGNFTRNHWNEVIQKGIGTILDYGTMPINNKGLLNADIAFKILPKEVLDEVKS